MENREKTGEFIDEHRRESGLSGFFAVLVVDSCTRGVQFL
jgi:hypothetical protein